MSESSWGLVRRVALSQEDTLGTSDGAWTQLAGIEDFTFSPDQEALPDNRHVTSTKSNHAPFLGPKSATASFRLPWHDRLKQDASPLLESAFGKVSADTITSTGGTASTITKTAGTFDPLLALTVGGVVEVRPVKSVAANDATLAIQASGASTAATNADATNGACYLWDPSVDTSKYVQLEIDQDTETDSLDWILKRGYVQSMTLELDLQARMAFSFNCQFHDWSQSSATNTAAPTAFSGHFLGLSGEAYLQSTGSPAAGTQLDLARVTVDLVVERIVRNAMRAPGGTVPGSAAVGIYPGRFAVGGVKLAFTKVSSTLLSDWEARTAKGLFLSWHMGRPGASTTKDIVALWLPRVVPMSKPQETDLDGLVGWEIDMTSEVDAALAAAFRFPALGIFSAA